MLQQIKNYIQIGKADLRIPVQNNSYKASIFDDKLWSIEGNLVPNSLRMLKLAIVRLSNVVQALMDKLF